MRTLGGRDDKVDGAVREEHEGTRELVPEEVRLEAASLAVRVLLVRVAGDDEEVVDLGQGGGILLLGLVGGARSSAQGRGSGDERGEAVTHLPLVKELCSAAVESRRRDGDVRHWEWGDALVSVTWAGRFERERCALVSEVHARSGGSRGGGDCWEYTEVSGGSAWHCGLVQRKTRARRARWSAWGGEGRT